MSYDPRALSIPVYQTLKGLRKKAEPNKERLKEQKNQAVELYTYLATWGLLRLKAEEKAPGKEGHKQVVEGFFATLADLAHLPDLPKDGGLDYLIGLDASHYLGLTGIALEVAKEFSFWATAVYGDVEGVQ